jgi:hypothetical protein
MIGYKLFRKLLIIKSLLGRFARLRKAASNFVISVCPSVCLSVRPHKNSAPFGRFSWKFVFRNFRKYVQVIKHFIIQLMDNI